MLPSLYIFIDTAIESPLFYDERPTPIPTPSPTCVDTTGVVKLVEKGNKSCAKIRKKGYCKFTVKNMGGKRQNIFVLLPAVWVIV